MILYLWGLKFLYILEDEFCKTCFSQNQSSWISNWHCISEIKILHIKDNKDLCCTHLGQSLDRTSDWRWRYGSRAGSLQVPANQRNRRQIHRQTKDSPGTVAGQNEWLEVKIRQQGGVPPGASQSKKLYYTHLGQSLDRMSDWRWRYDSRAGSLLVPANQRNRIILTWDSRWTERVVGGEDTTAGRGPSRCQPIKEIVDRYIDRQRTHLGQSLDRTSDWRWRYDSRAGSLQVPANQRNRPARKTAAGKSSYCAKKKKQYRSSCSFIMGFTSCAVIFQL